MNTNTFEQAIVNEIKGIKGCQFIGLTYKSEPDLNKSQKLAISAMVGSDKVLPIVKVCKGQFQVNFSYKNAVKNRAERERGESVEFISEPLRWGKWVEGQANKLIEHKGCLYLRFYGLKNGKTENEYFVGGKPATIEQSRLIEQFSEKGSVFTQSQVGLTENQVIARNVKVSNIISMSIDGKLYELRDVVSQSSSRMVV